jgi:RNA polymerase sigma factor (sigma-70 family)
MPSGRSLILPSSCTQCHLRHVSSASRNLEIVTEIRPKRAHLVERLQREEVATILNSLDDRLRLVLELRFGLSGEAPRSLVEVGKELGVTGERARQLEVRALDKMRTLGPDLRDYLEVA